MTELFAIRETEISVAEALAAVTRADAGGVALFVGTVRNHNDGRVVSLLEYQAYTSVAEKEMARIAAEIRLEIPDVALSVLHRVGSLGIGDIAVVCTASTPHRTEAFAACRLLIDRIKARVPIWKREHGPSGPYWVGWEDARCVPGEAHRHGHDQ